ncbi:hypothetical protein HYDPIDRAFT_113164 [Hydnomerulius pinastri MD-312]|uniref:Uncharacterized protein n=1 Tax=Hydnomerulius pinastri MD-312 TaxID=994086 RepID=A0A0C9WE73_9AGAM|nr:hypothetical protein HYDPIDRAFT_113164 [Hydnomerulius pinastri MD-312]
MLSARPCPASLTLPLLCCLVRLLRIISAVGKAPSYHHWFRAAWLLIFHELRILNVVLLRATMAHERFTYCAKRAACYDSAEEVAAVHGGVIWLGVV